MTLYEKMKLKILLIIGISAVSCIAKPDLEPHFFPAFDERDENNRIVGGNPTDILNFPYQASLQYFYHHSCGASIVSDRWLVSAAHCTQGSHPFPALAYTVRVGTSFVQSEGFVYAVSAIIQHPLYRNTNNLFDYDINLIRLSQPLVFRANIQPIPLASSDYVLVPGTISIVTGWGLLWEGGPGPSVLHFVELPILSNESCAQYFGGSFNQLITDFMFCAGLADGGRDACQNDSGGPLAINGTLVGVVSWGIGCAQPSSPGVYANIPALRQWIANVTSL